MLKFFRSLFVLFIFIGVFTVWARAEAVVDYIIASLDGEPYTLGDLRRFVGSLGGELPQNISKNNPEVVKYLRDMMLLAILEREAKSQGASVSDEDVRAYIKEVLRQNNATEEGLKKVLAEQNVSWSDYQIQIRRDILKNKVLGKEVRNKVSVTDGDINTYLEKHKELLPEPGSVFLEQILLEVDVTHAESVMRAKNTLASIKNSFATKGNWRSIAGNRYSSLGYVQPKDLRNDIREALEEVGGAGMTDVVDLGGMLALYVVSEPAQEGKVSGALKEKMRNLLFEEEFKKAMDKYLNEELPKKYSLDFKL